jgi:outer membrane protein
VRRTPIVVLLIATFSTVASAQAPGDPLRISLEDAMRTATRASYSIAAASAGVDRARADVTAARSGYFPQVTASASYTRTLATEFEGLFDTSNVSLGDMFGSLPFGRAHTWRAGIDASQLLFDAGRVGAGIDRARAATTLARLDERSRRAIVVLDITDAYATAVLADKLVAIGESSLGLAEQTLAQAKLGFDQGTAPEFDVVRAEVTRDTQRTAVIRARASRDLALLRVRRLLNLPLDRPLTLTTDLTGDPAPQARAVAGVEASAERLPVSQARATVSLRSADQRAARATRWPQFSAVTSYGVVDYPPDLLPDDDWRTNWTAGVQVTLPLFTGFRRTAAIRGANADRRAAEALLADASAQAALDQRSTQTAVDVATATLASDARSVDLARRAYQIAEVRYRQGVSTYLELADSRIALDRALVDQASAARDLQVARVRLALFPALPATATVMVPASTPTNGSVTSSPMTTPSMGASTSPVTPTATQGAGLPGAAGAPR